MVKFILVIGNPMHGYDFIGPFDNPEEAKDAVDQYTGNTDWWVAMLKEHNDD